MPSTTPATEGRVALVTGAARGLGAAVTRRLVGEGLVVVAADRASGGGGATPYAQATRADLDALASELGGRCRPLVVDVADEPALRDGLATLVGPGERLVRVVCAASTLEGGAPLWETDRDVLDRLWHDDAVSVWSTAVVTTPLLLEAAEGHGHDASFVAVVSAAGHRGLHHLSAYGVAKHAAVGVVRALAADLHGRPVTVCGVSPGSMDTDLLRATAAVYGLDSVEPLCAGSTTGAPLPPDAVASLVVGLGSAGPAVHGTVLEATGGWS